jgi:hypothetical protein
MSKLITDIPEALYQQLLVLAEKNQMKIEKFVEMALMAQVNQMNDNYLEERARRGSWNSFKEVLANVPAIEPEEFDKL